MATNTDPPGTNPPDTAQTPRRRPWLKWAIGAGVVVVVVVVLGPIIYFQFIADDPEPRLELSQPVPSSTTLPTDLEVPLAGEWTVSTGSTAGYRVDEVLFGRNNTATGRTSDVSGSMTIEATNVTAAKIVVKLANIDSGESRRDNAFRGRIMDVEQFPTATFELTEPIILGTAPADGEEITVPAKGNLTLRGQTVAVELELKAKRTGNIIEVLGTVPIEFSDYGIPNPSLAAITTEDHGEMEFLVMLQPVS